MPDLRSILTKYQIPWRDKGSNVSSQNIVIQCPYCGPEDRGQHCAIAEDFSGFYCFRNPHHQGSISYLFYKLHIPLKELGKNYKASWVVSEVEERNYEAGKFFKPASESEEAIAYLLSRGFQHPLQAIKQFNLKIGDTDWAGRLILPLTIGWVGRSMRDRIQPRYKVEGDTSSIWTYGKSSSCLLLEGALNGMRIACLTSQFALVASCGLGKLVSPTVILHLQQFQSIYYIPDGNVPIPQVIEVMKELSSYCPHSKVFRKQLPVGVKDPAVMNNQELKRWISTIGSSSWHPGPALGLCGADITAR
jgi:hypothetical protein